MTTPLWIKRVWAIIVSAFAYTSCTTFMMEDGTCIHVYAPHGTAVEFSDGTVYIL